MSVYDRGFLFGDAVFEVLRTYGGALFALGRALRPPAALGRARLHRRSPSTAPRCGPRSSARVAATGNDESNVRIVLTRGIGARDARSRDGRCAAPRGPRRAGRSPAARGVRRRHRGRHHPHAADRGRDRRVGREGDELPREPAGGARGEGPGRAGGPRRRRPRGRRRGRDLQRVRREGRAPRDPARRRGHPRGHHARARARRRDGRRGPGRSSARCAPRTSTRPTRSSSRRASASSCPSCASTAARSAPARPARSRARSTARSASRRASAIARCPGSPTAARRSDQRALAIASISTSAPRGSAETCTVTRAG